MYCARCERYIITTNRESWGMLAGYYTPVHKSCASPDELVKELSPLVIIEQIPVPEVISRRAMEPIFVKYTAKIISRGLAKYLRRYMFHRRYA